MAKNDLTFVYMYDFKLRFYLSACLGPRKRTGAQNQSLHGQTLAYRTSLGPNIQL
jgi:hypothetical protein